MAKHPVQQRAQMMLDDFEDKELQAWFSRALKSNLEPVPGRYRPGYDHMLVKMCNERYKALGFYTLPETRVIHPL